MAISRNLDIRIKEDSATLSERLFIYQNDRGIDLYFSISDCKYSFKNSKYNVIRSFGGVQAGATIMKPNKETFGANRLPIIDNRIKFTITHDLTDEMHEVGYYSIQIHLYDSENNRVTIPPVTFEVKKLIGIVE